MAGRFNFRAEWKLILDRGIGRLIYFKIQFIKHQINRQIKKDLSICITHQARSARQQWGEGGNSSQTWNAQRWRTTYLNFGKLGRLGILGIFPTQKIRRQVGIHAMTFHRPIAWRCTPYCSIMPRDLDWKGSSRFLLVVNSNY